MRLKSKKNRDGFILVQESIKHFPIPLRKSLKVVAKGDFLVLSCSLVLLFFGYGVTPAIISAEETPSTQQEKQEKREKISLDLKDVEIVELLRILSLKTNQTIVPNKEVTGRITIYLNNVTFQDVLDIVLLSQGLACDIKGNIYYIMSNAEYKRLYGKDYLEPRKVKTLKLTYAKPANVFNALSQLKSDIGKIIADEASGTLILIDIPEKLEALEKTAKELDQPLDTVVFDLNYAKAADAKTQLSAIITPGTGEVIVDERSSKAIITDLPKKMEKLSRIVREIDESSRQVFIEADIVEVNLSDQFQRGIDWEKVLSDRRVDGLDFVGKFPLTLATYQKLTIGTLARDHYTAVINFLETYGDVKTISQPRIAVVNNEEAKIMVGVRDAYVTQTLSQAQSTTVTSESVEFIDVGVKLKVVPTINKEGFITMKIKPEVSSVKEIITTALGSRIPIVQTAESETVVKVKDGTMIMIAGMIKEEKRDSIKGIPVLSKIPFLKVLFSSREKQNNRSELIVFLTPHLMKGDVALVGTEPEKHIPEEIMPPDLKKKISKEKTMSETLTQLELEMMGIIQAEVKPGPKAVKKPKKRKEEKTLSAQQAQAREYYRKGLEFQNLDNWPEAITYYQKAIMLDTSYAPPYNQLGIFFEAQGSPDRAEEMYLMTITVDPDYLAAYSNLALLNEARNNPDKAIEYWHKRIELGDEADPWTQTALRHLRELQAKK